MLKSLIYNDVYSQETLDGFGISQRSVDVTEHKQHLKHECTLGNCLPVGLNTFNLGSRGVFHVATGSNQDTFCIPRGENFNY